MGSSFNWQCARALVCSEQLCRCSLWMYTTCIMTVTKSSVYHLHLMSVISAPLSSSIAPPTQVVDFGKPAQFTCSYKGNPVKAVYWMKDGVKIGTSAIIY